MSGGFPAAPELDLELDCVVKYQERFALDLHSGQVHIRRRQPRAFVAATQDYHLRDGIAEQIQCPTLVCEAVKDLFLQELFDHLTCPKTIIKFTDAEGAGAHCDMRASRLVYDRMFDWPDETLPM